jgi:transcriptional regulator with XRE-family HTH domain
MPGDKTPRTPFGAAVREKRRARGLSQCDLAEACGWSQAKLSQLETGDRVPSLMDVVLLAPALECDPSWLTMLAIQSLEAA